LRFSPDGRSLSWHQLDGLRVYDRDTREYANRSFTIRRGNFYVLAAATAEGSRVISQHGMPDHCLIGWRRADDGDWVRMWSLSTADIAVSYPVFSSDGSLLALLVRDALGESWASNALQVQLRDAATGAVLGTGEYRHTYPGPLRFSPDNRQLLGFNGMSLIVWPVPELGSPRVVQNDTRKHFTALAYHPSGRHLFATSNDETVHVFDTATWERAGRFTWQLGKLKAVAVSPDGTLAAAGGDRGDIVIWDVDL
jgi:WD40 repeat protein